MAAAGVKFRLSEENIRKIVSAAGFTPRRRRMDYSLMQDFKGEDGPEGDKA